MQLEIPRLTVSRGVPYFSAVLTPLRGVLLQTWGLGSLHCVFAFEWCAMLRDSG